MRAGQEVYETYSLPEFDDSTWEKPVVVDTVMIEEFCTMPGLWTVLAGGS